MFFSCHNNTEVDEIVVPDELLEELASLRVTYANFLREYENSVQSDPKAQEAFVKTLSRLYRTAVGSVHTFQSCFDTLIDKDVSLFNITYLNQLVNIIPPPTW